MSPLDLGLLLCTLAQCVSVLHWGKMMPIFHLPQCSVTITPLGAMRSEEYSLECNVDIPVSLSKFYMRTFHILCAPLTKSLIITR